MDLTALPVEGRGAGLQASAESQMMGANLNQREMALVTICETDHQSKFNA